MGSENVMKNVFGATVAVAVLALIAFFVTFRPVYNGDMGVYRWRLRFAKQPDESLRQLVSTGIAIDWQPTSHDYPAFLGGHYWAEVKAVELETDWQKHPPRELWRHEIGGGWSAGLDAVTRRPRTLRDSIAGNLAVAQAVLPGVGGLHVLRSWATMNIDIDGAPILGEHPHSPGFFTAVGANGYTMGPLFGRVTAELILHGHASLDISRFGFARFAGLR